MKQYCGGCGIVLQDRDPDAPGFYRVPKKLAEGGELHAAGGDGGDSGGAAWDGGVAAASTNASPASARMLAASDDIAFDVDVVDEEPEDAPPPVARTRPGADPAFGKLGDGLTPQEAAEEAAFLAALDALGPDDEDGDDLDLSAEALGYELAEDGDEGEGERGDDYRTGSFDMDADLAAAAAAWGLQLDDAAGPATKARSSRPPLVPLDLEPLAPEDTAPAPVCARCFSLTHYGRVKSEAAEAALPGFDLARRVGSALGRARFRRQVLLIVVDAGDFDGSLPREAVRALLEAADRAAGAGGAWLRDGGGADSASSSSSLPPGAPRPPSIIIAVNKADVLPKAATPGRLEQWVRRRVAAAGLPRPSGVALVSAHKGAGVRPLLATLHATVGRRGDVWVVGAQNAGKSSLVNAMRAAVGRAGGPRALTASPRAGTTLGVLRVPGLLPAGCRLLDTPGVPHAHSLASRLEAVAGPADAAALASPGRLVPRTFRAAAGQTVLIGGVARIDVLDCPGATLYLTLWASPAVGSHFGKTERADAVASRAVGRSLTPPTAAVDDEDEGGSGDAAAAASRPPILPLNPRDVTVTGTGWRASTVDVAIAGLGWVGVGVGGRASLRVWTPPGVGVTVREALVPDFAPDLERPGTSAVRPPPKKVVAAAAKSGGKGGGGGKKGGGGGGGKKGGGARARRAAAA
jgi:uncharacterized membrane protein YgcG